MTQFQPGKTYYTRSLCDYDCIFRHRIISRTAKTVTIRHEGKLVRRGLTVRDGVEQFKPYGNYSMCAIITADKVEETQEQIPGAVCALRGNFVLPREA